MWFPEIGLTERWRLQSAVRQREEDKLERMLLEGVRSGRGVEIGSKEWDNFWGDMYANIRAKTHS